MKFSVARRICWPVAEDPDCAVLWDAAAWADGASATVAGRPIRRRSVARGTSSY